MMCIKMIDSEVPAYQFVVLLVVVMALLSGCEGGKSQQEKYYSRAKAYFDEGNIDKAQVEVKNLLQVSNNHPEGRYLLALIHEQDKNWRQMFANLTLVVDVMPKHLPARVKLGQVFLANQLMDKAREQADAVLALNPDYSDGLALKAMLFYREGESDKAIELANRALAEEPGHVGAIATMTAIYREQNPDLALSVIEEGLVLQSASVSLQMMKIAVLESQNRIDEAIRVYRKIVEQHPENLLYVYRLVSFYKKWDRLDDAEALLRQLVLERSNEDDIKLWLVQFLMDNRDVSQARETLEGFVDNQPDNFKLLFALAKVYMASGDLERTREYYMSIADRDQKGANALLAKNKLVELNLSAGQRKEAETLLAEIFSAEPQNTEALITRSRIALNENRFDTAIGDLRVVLGNESDHVGARSLLAKAHELDGALNLALDNYRQVLMLEPSNTAIMLQTARLAMKQGELDGVDSLMQRLLVMSPDNVEIAGTAVAFYSVQQDFEKASMIADQLLENPATQAQGYYMRGRIEMSNKFYEKAMESFHQAIELQPDAIEPLKFLVQSYLAQSKALDARVYLESFIEQYPDNALAYALQATVLQSEGDLEGAEGLLETALGLDLLRVSTYQQLGSLFSNQERYSAAIDLYQRGLRNISGNVTLQALLAASYNSNGMYDKAREVYELLLEENPGLQLAANNLANLLLEQFPGDTSYRQALQLTELLRGTQNPAYLDTMGWANYKAGQITRALSLLESAVALGGSGSEYHYHLGMAYYQHQEMEKAASHLSRALKDASEYAGREEAQKTLELIQSGSST